MAIKTTTIFITSIIFVTKDNPPNETTKDGRNGSYTNYEQRPVVKS